MPSPTTDRPLITVAEAAELLGKSRSATYVIARRHELPGCVVLNGRLHVRRAVLERWLAGQGGAEAEPEKGDGHA